METRYIPVHYRCHCHLCAGCGHSLRQRSPGPELHHPVVRRERLCGRHPSQRQCRHRHDNGLGGNVSYTYGTQRISDCAHCGNHVPNPMRRPVTEAIWRDGTGGEARSVYEYSGIKGQWDAGKFECLGHAWSRRWRYC